MNTDYYKEMKNDKKNRILTKNITLIMFIE